MPEMGAHLILKLNENDMSAADLQLDPSPPGWREMADGRGRGREGGNPTTTATERPSGNSNEVGRVNLSAVFELGISYYVMYQVLCIILWLSLIHI